MMDRLLRALDQKDPRLPPLIAVLLVLFLLIEAWLLVLRKPFAQYQQLSDTAYTLSMRANSGDGPSTELSRARQTLDALNAQLQKELKLVLASADVVAPLMQQLDQSAQASQLQLTSLRPSIKRRVSGFDERPFELSLRGDYLALANWMLKLNQTVGHNLIMTDMDLHREGHASGVTLNLRLALYLPAAPGVAP